jgi:hypothetical protein
MGISVVFVGAIDINITDRTFNQKRMQIKIVCKEKGSLKVQDQGV